jgi:predicted TIM-barrel fold metal-dependent hydrolase
MAQVLMTPQTRGIPFGNPHFDPLYAAASANGFPVATHLMGQTPFELIPLYPVGNPAHWHDFFASWPLLYVSHLMSLVFDGAFDRHPDLRVVFVEGGFTWAMPVMSRMDRIWEARRADLPHVRRRPSEYVREHVRFTTQPLEDADVGQFREYLEMMDLGDNLMFSTDYPHWSYDSPRRTGSGSCAATRPHCTAYRRPSRPFPANDRPSVSVLSEAVAGSAARLKALESQVYLDDDLNEGHGTPLRDERA